MCGTSLLQATISFALCTFTMPSFLLTFDHSLQDCPGVMAYLRLLGVADVLQDGRTVRLRVPTGVSMGRKVDSTLLYELIRSGSQLDLTMNEASRVALQRIVSIVAE